MRPSRRLRCALLPMLALALALLPLPCADDLLVELGFSQDLCGVGSAAAPVDSRTPEPSPSTCPCACHVGIAVGPSLAQLPEPLDVPLPVAPIAATLEGIPPAITHPPLA